MFFSFLWELLQEGLVMRGTGTITYQNRTGQLQPLSPFFITPSKKQKFNIIIMLYIN